MAASPIVDEKNEKNLRTNAASQDSSSIEVAAPIIKGEDEASRFVAGHAVAVDESTNKRLRRKIDRCLLPWMCVLYMLQFLDKTTLSYASTMNLFQDTGINSAQYAWTGSIFYLGYLCFEYPHNRLMQRFPLAKYLSISVMIWGVTLACMAATTNFAGLMVCRFFLGAMEGSVTAGFVLVTSRWYRTSEQAFRTSVWFSCNGFAQIIGGAVAYGVGRGFRNNLAVSVSGWKFLFILTGLITSCYGALLFFFLADSPITAKWLSEEDRHLAVERLRGNQQGIGSKVFKWYQVRETFSDIRTYLFFLFTVTVNIPSGGLTVFFTQLIGGYGFDADTTFLVAMPGGAVQLICNLGFPYLAYRTHNRMLIASASMVLGIAAISTMAGLAMHDPLNAKIGQLVAYYIVYGNSPTALILILGLVASNCAGYTKKTTTNAVTLIGYCVGFLIGPQTFRDGPYYYNAKYDIIAQWTVSLFCCLAMYFVNRRENNKRQREWEAEGRPAQPEGEEFLDLTDGENKFFRYAL